ncbi:cytochrome P450 [Ramaria rubella]|nr:cytochrome P450 [Ramaria rubella]
MSAWSITQIVFTIIFGVFAVAIRASFLRKRIPKGIRLPPGPQRKLISGNAANFPTRHQWETFTQWTKEYGDLLYLEIYGNPIVIVNSTSVAADLFEKRSKIYSDRAEFPMMNGLMGFDWDFGLMRYGDWWRRHRKAFHQEFYSTSIVKYHDIQTRQTRRLLHYLRETPNDFSKHIRHLSGAIILEVTYGFDVPPGHRYIEVAGKAAAAMVDAGTPGAFLVDSLPILKYVPEWMVGAGFQKIARETRLLTTEVAEAPFAAVKEQLNAGTTNPAPSVLTSLLEKLQSRPNSLPDEEVVIRNVAAVAYLAGADTTVSALNTFMLAMLLYPEVQKKAQAELDSTIGKNRLPDFGDRGNLPYIEAVVRETLRWHPVVPLGVPHRTTKDDIYNGYFIPGGSIVIGNSWAMLYDEKTYGPEPEKFIPERFLNSRVGYPMPCFGFGRRVCPGRYLADNSVFIGIATILQVFDITPAKDTDGNEITVEPLFTSGFLSYPEAFQCSIIARSASALNLIPPLAAESA